MIKVNVQKLISQLQAVKDQHIPDEALRKQLYDATREVGLALETPREGVERIFYAPLQLVMAKVASDMGIFELLAANEESSKSTFEFADVAGADPVLTHRILRYLASVGMVKELGDERFAPNDLTKTLSIPGNKAGIDVSAIAHLPAWAKLPEFLARTKYQNPVGVQECPFQLAHNTDQSMLGWLTNQEGMIMKYFQWLAESQKGLGTWLDIFPAKDLFQGSKKDTPLFVDVDGGLGHQCIALRAKYPKTHGRVILQDLPHIFQQVIPLKRVEVMEHDLDNEQPVKGASISLSITTLSGQLILNRKCIDILRNIIPAMDERSVIVIDAMVLPNQGTDWQSAQHDMHLMACMAGMERGVEQWYVLLDAAGLKVQDVQAYASALPKSIIMAVPK
ncbi:hypothetical protein MMC30_000764 [Trapelia coarctata]|nr:hypothetical protein [Trapelia coarctata]